MRKILLFILIPFSVFAQLQPVKVSSPYLFLKYVTIADSLKIKNYWMPISDGSNGQYIKTDGAGHLTFGTISTGGKADTATRLLEGYGINISGNGSLAANRTITVDTTQVATPYDLATYTGSTTITTLGTISTGTVPLANTSGTLGETRGGTNQTTYTTGDILYSSASNTLSKLAIGTSGKVLQSNGTIPTWATLSVVPVDTSRRVVAYRYNKKDTTFYGKGGGDAAIAYAIAHPSVVYFITSFADTLNATTNWCYPITGVTGTKAIGWEFRGTFINNTVTGYLFDYRNVTDFSVLGNAIISGSGGGFGTVSRGNQTYIIDAHFDKILTTGAYPAFNTYGDNGGASVSSSMKFSGSYASSSSAVTVYNELPARVDYNIAVIDNTGNNTVYITGSNAQFTNIVFNGAMITNQTSNYAVWVENYTGASDSRDPSVFFNTKIKCTNTFLGSGSIEGNVSIDAIYGAASLGTTETNYRSYVTLGDCDKSAITMNGNLNLLIKGNCTETSVTQTAKNTFDFNGSGWANVTVNHADAVFNNHSTMSYYSNAVGGNMTVTAGQANNYGKIISDNAAGTASHAITVNGGRFNNYGMIDWYQTGGVAAYSIFTLSASGIIYNSGRIENHNTGATSYVINQTGNGTFIHDGGQLIGNGTYSINNPSSTLTIKNYNNYFTNIARGGAGTYTETITGGGTEIIDTDVY